jgi:hypothetical protein
VTSIPTIAGVSLDRLIRSGGTPRVHATYLGSVIVTRVETIELDADASRQVWVDAELEPARPAGRSAR